MSPFDPPLEPGEILAAIPGRFDEVHPIKAGGQGAVFRTATSAMHPLGRGSHLALKVYFVDQMEERTDREVAALQRIRVETLVRFVDNGRCELREVACMWLETEFIEGESLAGLIVQGPRPISEVARTAHDVALALVAIWDERIVHRDVKPDNIMVTPQGRAILIDLGVARHVDLSSLTTRGRTWGTEGYLSPEQAIARRSLTCKSDVFALGVAAQESILGRHPTQRRQQLLMNGGPNTRGLRAAVPPEFAATIDDMVRRDPVGRPHPVDVAARMRPFMEGDEY